MSDVRSNQPRRGEAESALAVLDELCTTIQAATSEVVWRQWGALGGMASGRQRAKALIDPEALVLISLALEHSEPRLADLLGDWTIRNSDLLSVGRMRSLAERYPAPTRALLRGLARSILVEAKDHRWKALIDGEARELIRRRNKKRAVRAHAVEPAALTLRLRLMFGVGIKADLLSFLLTTGQEVGASVSVTATATGYTVAAVRKAANDLVEARLIETVTETRAEYRAPRTGWCELLGVKEMPRWRGWNERFVFVAAFLNWATQVRERPLTTYALESSGRDLLGLHARAFRWHRVWQSNDSPATSESTGTFASAIKALSSWMLAEV